MGATIFFHLVSARYERGSIILSSNKSYADWGSIFGDPIIATAILDRLLHHSTTINIRGESYRLKDRRRAGLLPRSEQEAPLIAPPVFINVLFTPALEPACWTRFSTRRNFKRNGTAFRRIVGLV